MVVTGQEDTVMLLEDGQYFFHCFLLSGISVKSPVRSPTHIPGDRPGMGENDLVAGVRIFFQHFFDKCQWCSRMVEIHDKIKISAVPECNIRSSFSDLNIGDAFDGLDSRNHIFSCKFSVDMNGLRFAG